MDRALKYLEIFVLFIEPIETLAGLPRQELNVIECARLLIIVNDDL